jgi:hypothetical protein
MAERRLTYVRGFCYRDHGIIVNMRVARTTRTGKTKHQDVELEIDDYSLKRIVAKRAEHIKDAVRSQQHCLVELQQAAQ